MSTNINEELANACHKGNLQEVKRLLAAGADVNASTTSNAIANGIAVYFFSRPLHIAASFGFVDVVQCLVENGADIEAQSFKRSQKNITERCLFDLICLSSLTL